MSADILARLRWAEEVRDNSRRQYEKWRACPLDDSSHLKLTMVTKELEINEARITQLKAKLQKLLDKEQPSAPKQKVPWSSTSRWAPSGDNMDVPPPKRKLSDFQEKIWYSDPDRWEEYLAQHDLGDNQKDHVPFDHYFEGEDDDWESVRASHQERPTKENTENNPGEYIRRKQQEHRAQKRKEEEFERLLREKLRRSVFEGRRREAEERHRQERLRQERFRQEQQRRAREENEQKARRAREEREEKARRANSGTYSSHGPWPNAEHYSNHAHYSNQGGTYPGSWSSQSSSARPKPNFTNFTNSHYKPPPFDPEEFLRGFYWTGGCFNCSDPTDLQQQPNKSTLPGQERQALAKWRKTCEAAFADLSSCWQFPEPPAFYCPNAACLDASKRHCRACKDSIVKAFNDSSLFPEGLKKERLRWHPDRWAVCPVSVRKEMQAKAGEVFAIINNLYQKK